MTKMEKKKNEALFSILPPQIIWTKQLLSNVNAVHLVGFHAQPTSVQAMQFFAVYSLTS